MNNSVSINSLQQSLVTASGGVLAAIIAFIPQFLAAVVVFILGVYLSKWIKSLLISILQAVNIYSLTKNTALENFLKRADIRIKIEELLGEAIRWLILYIFIIASVNILGLTTVGDFLTGILSYVPQVISASLILALGILAAGFTESIVKGAVASFDPTTARMVGKIASYTVVVFAALVAIGELGIAESFINTLFIGFVAMLSIGLGLAFGLGAKDVVNLMLTKWYQDFNKTTKKR
jgi:hypothetical protein